MSNKVLIQRFYAEVFNNIDEAVAHEILADDFTVHAIAPLQPIIGVETFLDRVRQFHHAFPDVYYQVEDQVAGGDKVATRFLATGTHKGEFLGEAATNKQVS